MGIIKSKELKPLVQERINDETIQAGQVNLTLKDKAKRIIAEIGKTRLLVTGKVNRAAESTSRSSEMENQTELDTMLATKTINEIELKTKSTAKLISPSLYESEIRVLTSGAHSNQVNKLEHSLGLIEGLQIVFIGGSEGKDTEFVVSTDKPILLINTLKEMPFTERVIDNGRIIQVTMKT